MNNIIAAPPPLPANPEDWVIKIKQQRSINDHVQDVHVSLLNDPEKSDPYKRLLLAVHDSQAVEGSLSADNTLAALMLRDKAKEMVNIFVQNEKLATINLALGVVLRRYKLSRKQRRNMVGGETVPNNGDDE